VNQQQVKRNIKNIRKKIKKIPIKQNNKIFCCLFHFYCCCFCYILAASVALEKEENKTKFSSSFFQSKVFFYQKPFEENKSMFNEINFV
jgi:hypothetical protein